MMNALHLALAAALLLWLGYRFYGRFVLRRVFGAGEFADDRIPSRAREDGQDFVPTRRSVLFGHHYVTIAGAGPIVGPAVAVTWGWLPALLWVVLGSIFIGAVHDLGALIASVRNRGRTIGDLAADIMTPRVRLLFLLFIGLALWVVLAVFAFVIAALFRQTPESVLAIWIEVPLALFVGWRVTRHKGRILPWSVLALALLYVAVGVGMIPAVRDLFATGEHGILIWLAILFVYCYVASVLPVTQLLQPRDYINSHQLFLALAVLLAGIAVAAFSGAGHLALVAPAINPHVPAAAPPLYPFLFITIACGAISGFHCMVASGTTARQLATERDAHAIGYGAMILEGALAVVVILCCVSAAGFPDVAAWDAKYSATWVDRGSMLDRLEGFIQGGAHLMALALPLLDHAVLATVITVVIISFAATTMDSATRIQRYVIAEVAEAVRMPALGGRHAATAIAVGSAAALAMLAGSGGSGGLVLWPVFGVMNQMLACLTFLVLTTWQAKRGKPLLATALPLGFLVVTVTWAATSQILEFAREPGKHAHLIFVLSLGLLLEGWMIVEGVSALRLARKVRRQGLQGAERRRAMAGAAGRLIDVDGVIG